MHALGLEFGSAAQLSKRPGSVWNCLWGNALKRSPGIIRKSRVSYPGPGFLSSATWPSLPKKHYNGLNQIKNGKKRYEYIVVGYKSTYFVKDHSEAKNKYTEDDIVRMIEFFIDNIFVESGGVIFQQVIGIPMGTNCAPLLADLFCIHSSI